MRFISFYILCIHVQSRFFLQSVMVLGTKFSFLTVLWQLLRSGSLSVLPLFC